MLTERMPGILQASERRHRRSCGRSRADRSRDRAANHNKSAANDLGLVLADTCMTDGDILTVEVAVDLKQPLESLAGSLRRLPTWIVNRALEEYLERRLRPDHDATAAGTSS
jgi:hypothetical protein